MLIFFIHGVATRDVKYADGLKELLRKEFTRRGQRLPHFHSGFWGNVLSDLGQMWNSIDEGFQQHGIQDTESLFRYQKFRKGFLSDFVGDAFTYLNPERGTKIRGLILQQLQDFTSRYPQEEQLHIIAHSLGAVVLWDILFSNRFSSNDPAFEIRGMLRGNSDLDGSSQVCLKSITTMGSPIPLFNLMFDVSSKKSMPLVNQDIYSLKWINVVHSSDIIAYPIKSSLEVDSSWDLSVHDEFIQKDSNAAERAVRKFVESPAASIFTRSQAYIDAISHAPMVAGAGDAHRSYWNCNKTTVLIADNILDEEGSPGPKLVEILQEVISRLGKVPGMTKHLMHMNHSLDTTLVDLNFKDGSGKLKLDINPVGVHHVYVFDRDGTCKFGGYVGWMHTNRLKKKIDLIRKKFC